MQAALPVDSCIDTVRGALQRYRAAILVAAPGAGKTTRVPPALVDRGRVLLLQPRRVAARAMARRIADERGWTVGREIGWHIRFERQFTAETRLLVVTEGILTAYLQDDPLLSEVTTLVVDEFHERSVHADLGLALAKQAWLARSDLRIMVMSATLDTAPVAAFLGGCPVIDVPGTLHPLTVEHVPGGRMADAVGALLPRTQGHILCFMPGVREINDAINECSPLARTHDLDVVPLHGSLDGDAQDAALSADGPRRRVIVATNVAETSLTVPGVSAVVDSGLHKVARYDAERGVDSLTTERITQDSADQRAGRAARVGPGFVLRLWDARDRLRPHREAEIHRVDLAGPLLSILAWGGSPAAFEWFDRPADDRIAQALALLERLGAVSAGQITAVGRQLQRLPLHPRLGRVLLEARGSFEGAAGCAWLSEPATIDVDRAVTSCDLLPILDRWPQMPAHLRRVADTLQKAVRPLLGERYREHISEEQLRRALWTGYPDRVARRRTGPQRAQTRSPGPQKPQIALHDLKVTLATGHGAIIGRESGVRGAEWLVALEVTSGRTVPVTEAVVRLASAIDPDWLAPTRSEVVTELDGDTIKAREVDWYDEVMLHDHPIAVAPERRAELLVAAWLQRAPDGESRRLLRRLEFARVAADVRALARAAAQTARRLSDVILKEESLTWEERQQLHRHAPAALTVPSGRDMTIEYGDDGTVAVSVKLQELFGLADTPRVGPSRTPITFHLLAPSGRPVQTTQDLKSFWERTYPEVRKELRGRYPRHPWPEDPWNALPTHRTKKHSSL